MCDKESTAKPIGYAQSDRAEPRNQRFQEPGAIQGNGTIGAGSSAQFSDTKSHLWGLVRHHENMAQSIRTWLNMLPSQLTAEQDYALRTLLQEYKR